MEDRDKEVALKDEQLEKIAGGSTLDNVPTVDEHDYDDEVRDKVKGA